MAKRRRIKSLSKLGRKKSSADKAKNILQRLKATYALGQRALAESDRNQIVVPNGDLPSRKTPTKRASRVNGRRRPYARNVIVGLAKELGVHPNEIETARRIADCYDERRFKALIRRRTRSDKPLTTGHLAHLSSIRDSKQRTKFEGLAIEHDWSVRMLASAIKQEQIQRGHVKATVGNKPIIPKSLPEIVVQVQRYCDQWSRWSQTFALEMENRADKSPMRNDIIERIAAIDGEVAAIRGLVGDLVARSKNRRSKKKRKGRPGTHSTVAGGVKHQQPAKKR